MLATLRLPGFAVLRCVACVAALLVAGVLAPAAVAPLHSQAHAQSLAPGDPAPALTDVDWLMGEEHPEFKEGHVYILDFWATWCRPCIASMPHLKKLQEQYEDDNVHVIGVAIWPTRRMTPTEEWIKDPPDEVGEITWTIAEDRDSKTADAFMKAAGRNGIPTVMIVDRAGKIAWMGHPMAMDDVLAKVVSGEFDVTEEAERRARLQEVQGELEESFQAGEFGRVLVLIDELMEIDAEMFADTAIVKYNLLLDEMDDAEAAAAWGRKVVSDVYPDNVQVLNFLSWSIVDPNSPAEKEDRDIELAALAAERANRLSESKDHSVLDTLARVRYWQGDLDAAINLQKAAISFSGDSGWRNEYRKTLNEYTELRSAQSEEAQEAEAAEGESEDEADPGA